MKVVSKIMPAYQDGSRIFAGDKMDLGLNVTALGYYNRSKMFINRILQSQINVTDDVTFDEVTGMFDATNGSVNYAYWSPTAKDYRGEVERIPAGVYVLTWEGTATFRFVGVTPSNLLVNDEANNRMEFEVTNPDDPYQEFGYYLDFKNGTVGNVKLYRKEYEQRLQTGEVFAPDFLADMAGYGIIRYMDAMDTNSSEAVDYTDFATSQTPSFHTVENFGKVGMPIEFLCQLSNTVGADGWFCIPHKATDDCVLKIAQTIRDNLNPDRKAYIEFSNEIWNFSPPFNDQSKWAMWMHTPTISGYADATGLCECPGHGLSTGDEIWLFDTLNGVFKQGVKRFTIIVDADHIRLANTYDDAIASIDSETLPNPGQRIMAKKVTGHTDRMHDNFSDRCLQVWALCKSVLGGRAISVLGSQAANPAVTAARVRADIKRAADVVAIAPYYYCTVDGFGDMTVAEFSQAGRNQITESIVPKLNDHAQHLGRYDIVAYEGGDHNAINSSVEAENEIIIAYAESQHSTDDYNWYLRQTAKEGLTAFCLYTSHSRLRPSGGWGIMQDSQNVEAPRYKGIADFLNGGVPRG